MIAVSVISGKNRPKGHQLAPDVHSGAITVSPVSMHCAIADLRLGWERRCIATGCQQVLSFLLSRLTARSVKNCLTPWMVLYALLQQFRFTMHVWVAGLFLCPILLTLLLVLTKEQMNNSRIIIF